MSFEDPSQTLSGLLRRIAATGIPGAEYGVLYLGAHRDLKTILYREKAGKRCHLA
jgi:hypothetical protein